jgi:hypothetical protein
MPALPEVAGAALPALPTAAALPALVMDMTAVVVGVAVLPGGGVVATAAMPAAAIDGVLDAAEVCCAAVDCDVCAGADAVAPMAGFVWA